MSDRQKFFKLNTDGKAIRICPRCGRELTGYPALSRIADMDICDQCGTDEAMEDFFAGGCMPVEGWYIFIHANELKGASV